VGAGAIRTWWRSAHPARLGKSAVYQCHATGRSAPAPAAPPARPPEAELTLAAIKLAKDPKLRGGGSYTSPPRQVAGVRGAVGQCKEADLCDRSCKVLDMHRKINKLLGVVKVRTPLCRDRQGQRR
jgi:hypothetical protein